MNFGSLRPKKSSKDVFKAYLFEGATFTEDYDLPILPAVHYIPNRVQTFSEARNKKRADVDACVCFYEHDQLFEPFCNRPKNYLEMLSKHPAVVMPDKSTYFDMPYWMQGNNVLMNYGYAWWMHRQGLLVVPNARVVSPLPVESTLGGIPKHSTIAIGEQGNLKSLENRQRFVKDVKTVVDYLEPSNIIEFGSNVYGAFDYPLSLGIRVDFYPPRIAEVHGGDDAYGE